MDDRLRIFTGSVSKMLMKKYREIIYVDMKEDSYSYVTYENGSFVIQEKESETASEFLSFVVNSPLCHEDDRDKLKDFGDFDKIIDYFKHNEFKPFHIIYRRKFRMEDTRYSFVMLNVVPEGSVDDPKIVLFVRDITPEFDLLKREVNDKYEDEGILNNGKRGLLIVDDDDFSREMLVEMLQEDYEVYQANNGVTALEILEEYYSDISVIISDINMPMMGGYELLNKLHKDPLLSAIPVIVMTAEGEEEKCLSLGASDFVSKPLNHSILVSRINSIIRLRESSTALSSIEFVSNSNIYTRQAFIHHAGNALNKHPEVNWTLMIYDIGEYRKIIKSQSNRTFRDVAFEIGHCINELRGYHLLAGKYNNDQFVLLTDAKCEEFIDQLSRNLKNNEMTVAGKIGAYERNDTDVKLDDAIDNALEALNVIIDQYDRRYYKYDDELQRKKEKRIIIESNMEEALNDDQFVVYYQPKHDAKSGELLGAEALLRWISPDYGFMSPGDFISIFEENGFISKADEFVWDRTCFNIRKWLDNGLKAVPISINSSKRDFDRNDFLERRMLPMKENDLDPSYLHIEVTESLFAEDVEELSAVLRKCQEQGFKIELDDFGAGYSSLNIVTSLPLDIMKLDMSFMRQFDDEKKRKVFAFCVSLAKTIGLKTVSEGVETDEQAKLVSDLGVDVIQGYYYSRPLPEKEFEQYLMKYQGK